MAENLIQLQDVSKIYTLGDEEIRALDGVTLSVKRGEFVAIVGPSGSGKSTLSNVIGGLDRPDAGTITVSGKDLAKTNDRDLSRYRNEHVGFVFQTFNLQPYLTALENVMLPMILARISARTRKEHATKRLTEVGLQDRLKHRPTQLSGGQRQRVSIARALANDPDIIIADEPTGNLDSKKGREIIALLKKLNKQGTTLLVVTHDTSVANQADHVVSLLDGKLSERGAK